MAGTQGAVTFESAVGEQRWKLPALTADQVRALPVSMEMVYAARALGKPRDTAYREAAKVGALLYGQARVPVTRVGRAWRVLRSDLMQVLGMVDVAPAAPPAPGTRPAA